MLSEVDVLGAFMPSLVVWLAPTLVIFAIADALLTKVGFFRLFWHAPLVRFALFVGFFCGVGLALGVN
jgi:Protein of unknown function (DUF1656)